MKTPQKRQLSLPRTPDSTDEPPRKMFSPLSHTLNQRVTAMTTRKGQIKNEEEENTAMPAVTNEAATVGHIVAQSLTFEDLMSELVREGSKDGAVPSIESKGVNGVSPSAVSGLLFRGRRAGWSSDSPAAPSSASIPDSSASGVGDSRTLSELEKKVGDEVTRAFKALELSKSAARMLAVSVCHIIAAGSDVKEKLKVKVHKSFKALKQDKDAADLLLSYLNDFIGGDYIVIRVVAMDEREGSDDSKAI